MTFLEHPLLMMIGAEVEPELPVGCEIPEDSEVPHSGLIFLICTTCGHFLIAHMDYNQFDMFINRRLKIELDEKGGVQYHYFKEKQEKPAWQK
jgi:hypothetical protein